MPTDKAGPPMPTAAVRFRARANGGAESLVGQDLHPVARTRGTSRTTRTRHREIEVSARPSRPRRHRPPRPPSSSGALDGATVPSAVPRTDCGRVEAEEAAICHRLAECAGPCTTLRRGSPCRRPRARGRARSGRPPGRAALSRRARCCRAARSPAVLAEQQRAYATLPPSSSTRRMVPPQGRPRHFPAAAALGARTARSDDETRQIVAFRLERDGASQPRDRARRAARRGPRSSAPSRRALLRLLSWRAAAASARWTPRPGAGLRPADRPALDPTLARLRRDRGDRADGGQRLDPRARSGGRHSGYSTRAWSDCSTPTLASSSNGPPTTPTSTSGSTSPTASASIYSDPAELAGGQISNDMTDGYGPEEYVIRRAPARHLSGAASTASTPTGSIPTARARRSSA